MRTLILILWLTQTFIAYAQPVTIDNVPVHVEYYRLPDQPLDPSYSTYSADLDISYSELGKTGLSKSSLIDQYVRLEGYKQVSSKGDVEVTARIGDFTIWNESRSSRRSKTKDKDGTEHVKYSYYMEVKYSMPVTLQVYDRKGKLLTDTYVSSNSNTQTWTSPSYSNFSDLESYWRIQRSSRLSQLQKERMEQGLKALYDELNYRYGYRKTTENVKFETIGKKKHELYDVFDKNVESIKSAFAAMRADRDLKEVRQNIKPAMDFYAAQAVKFKSGSKDDMRLRHICLYNQALAYFWTENFDQAESLVKEIQRKDSKDRDAKHLLQDIENTRSSLSRNNRSSRHMVTVGSKT